MLIGKRRKSGFMLSDALIGLVLISAGLILYTQVQLVMQGQLEQRQERVLQLRHQMETEFKAQKQVAK
ncbi:hypothetical protein IWT140_01357 [Secundilactobacillus pentosiphilus]|uniref:Uncharacterized protein n=1 Tax=Secundilactobacillus pentosiphilus TaxID=1714682 RepID=A0A1Z5IZE9_9LACO|nr:hypothetical protein [Secundilactobacillus pentosiphilus]GAX03732.1 hypothetical protein IWT140_01357 [Secundilactobacillus pentosiphilus]GAX07155.1 hypothetical protein IWT25_02503 [Secundilactobacillus pentosiphilus]